jgi:hypothetical protein
LPILVSSLALIRSIPWNNSIVMDPELLYIRSEREHLEENWNAVSQRALKVSASRIRLEQQDNPSWTLLELANRLEQRLNAARTAAYESRERWIQYGISRGFTYDQITEMRLIGAR